VNTWLQIFSISWFAIGFLTISLAIILRPPSIKHRDSIHIQYKLTAKDFILSTFGGAITFIIFLNAYVVFRKNLKINPLKYLIKNKRYNINKHKHK
jgi:hypothetical protein